MDLSWFHGARMLESSDVLCPGRGGCEGEGGSAQRPLPQRLLPKCHCTF